MDVEVRCQLQEVLHELDMPIRRHFTKMIHFAKMSLHVETGSTILLAEVNLTSCWGFKEGRKSRPAIFKISLAMNLDSHRVALTWLSVNF